MMLKIAGGLILTLSVATCAAQSSHVGIAYQLYKSCYQGTLQAQSIDPELEFEIQRSRDLHAADPGGENKPIQE